jgi:hypothetical protein
MMSKHNNRKMISRARGGGIVPAIVAAGIASIIAITSSYEIKMLFRAKDEIAGMSEVQYLREMIPQEIDCEVAVNHCGTNQEFNKKRINLHKFDYGTDHGEIYDKSVLLATMPESWITNSIHQPGWKARHIRVRSMCMGNGVLLQYQTKKMSEMKKTSIEMQKYEQAGASETGRWLNVFGENNLICKREKLPGSAQWDIETNNFARATIRLAPTDLGGGRVSEPYMRLSYTPTRNHSAFTVSGVLQTRGDGARCGLFVHASQNGKTVFGSSSRMVNNNYRELFTLFKWHDRDWNARFSFSRRAAFNTIPNVPVVIEIEKFSGGKFSNSEMKPRCWLVKDDSSQRWLPEVDVEK